VSLSKKAKRQRNAANARKALAAKRHAEHPERKPLTEREKLFVSYYLSNNWNGTKAAAAVGWSFPSVAASKALARVNVKHAIQQELRKTHLSKDQVLARIGEMATGDISDFTDENGNIDFKAVKRKGYLVKKLRTNSVTRTNEETKERVVEANHAIELHDSLSALDKLGKVHGMFTEKVEVTGKDGTPFEFALRINPEEMP
jgi:phage terminase small subunit